MQQKKNHIRHIKNDKLPVIKPDYRGNKTQNGRFFNVNKLYEPELGNVLRWKFSANPQRDEKKFDTYVPATISNCDFIHAEEDMIVWLGHASFFIRFGGVTFLTDPIFYDLPMMKRRTSLPCAPEKLKNIDFLLLSHAHRDHLDKKSIQKVYEHNPQIKSLVPLQAGSLLRSIERHLPYQEAGWYQRFDLTPDHVEIYFLPASHWHRRGLNDMNKVLWGSFLLKTQNQTLYFAGDTALDSHFEEIEALFGPVDVCIMPVGAYKPSFLMQQSHLNPNEAVKAFNILRGGTFIPMHYGTFDLSDEPAGEPVRLLQKIAAAGLLQGLQLPAIGEPLLLKELL
ncbi:MBL fold metallo-hydrolase [Pontibacter vulgaris]|uniref:MBL fold metallo-hydrolase n=1 Tax=Pontibacter vulgaris TaxID=2905679 RepID=UPI001FA76209|nr:MBL fold metallo-hydrolase [Pontibacter vulgaris]